ncbi:MAG TPA: polymer-forming cytoskeletal protein [Myxococcota bacterium]|nr:polymer-forming cytoskeletal protein [Myxococcota bacterium]HQK51532.1 polymer-forming cytoskeletal protein [Myxococcota bacterium]
MAGQDGSKTEIGPATRVIGDVEAEEDVFVLGRLEGTVRSTASVVIEEGGLVLGQVEAAFVVIAGRLEGTAVAEKRLEITETGTVLGDLAAPALVMLEGGAVRGRVAMDGTRPSRAATPAPSRTPRPAATTGASAGATRRGGSATRSGTTSTQPAPRATPRSGATRNEPVRELPLDPEPGEN